MFFLSRELLLSEDVLVSACVGAHACVSVPVRLMKLVPLWLVTEMCCPATGDIASFPGILLQPCRTVSGPSQALSMVDPHPGPLFRWGNRLGDLGAQKS